MPYDKTKLIRNEHLAKEKQDLINARLAESKEKELKVLALIYEYKTEPRTNTERRIELSSSIDQAKLEYAKFLVY